MAQIFYQEKGKLGGLILSNPTVINKTDNCVTLSAEGHTYELKIDDKEVFTHILTKLEDSIGKDVKWNMYEDLFHFYIKTDFDIGKVQLRVI